MLQYSFSLTTFSPSGKLVQIEYALNAVNQGATSLGIKAANGVVIATEKKVRSTLVDDTTLQRITLLTPNIGVAYSGMGPDSRVLVRKARKQAQVSFCHYLAVAGFLGVHWSAEDCEWLCDTSQAAATISSAACSPSV